jgi:hypothetical protein
VITLGPVSKGAGQFITFMPPGLCTLASRSGTRGPMRESPNY